MQKRIGSYPRVRTEGGGRGVVSHAGGVLLIETIRKTGLDQAISAAPVGRLHHQVLEVINPSGNGR
ncbi:hypothetical protein GA0115240_134610 [Streptomyces sp. DvalAA-14]|nr:hypothetical protein GA0115240_134610 [Streptomyces sp. DvalAA-14]